VIVDNSEYLDFSKVPESRGIPKFLYVIVAIGVIGIFAVGADVVFNASYGHHWPSNTTERTPLQNTGSP
jgi:hypothetical protein